MAGKTVKPFWNRFAPPRSLRESHGCVFIHRPLMPPFPRGPDAYEVSDGVTSGVRKERIVHPGLLAAPDLLRDASERMSPDRGGSLFSCRPFYGVKPTFREAAPGLIICLICGSIRSRIPPGGRGSRLPGRRETVMGSHRLRRSTVLKEKMLLSIGSQAETRSSIRDDARDCRYTDLAVSGFETPAGAQGVSSLPSNHLAAVFFIHT